MTVVLFVLLLLLLCETVPRLLPGGDDPVSEGGGVEAAPAREMAAGVVPHCAQTSASARIVFREEEVEPEVPTAEPPPPPPPPAPAPLTVSSKTWRSIMAMPSQGTTRRSQARRQDTVFVERTGGQPPLGLLLPVSTATVALRSCFGTRPHSYSVCF